MQESKKEIQCNGKEDFMAHVKKGVAEYAMAVADYPEVYGAVCVVDVGERTEVYQLGNEKSLRNINYHIARQAYRGSLANKLGKAIILFGLGVLVGMML